MSIRVSDLAYAYPGGGELFFDVNFGVASGEHVSLVGANGVGKSSMMKILAGEQEPTEGNVTIGGSFLYMPQNVGYEQGLTVRELLLRYAPPAQREPGLRMVDCERRLAEGDMDAGMEIGDAINEWADAGGYQLEAQWDASIQRVVRSTLIELGDKPSAQLSGGELKQLVLDLAFNSAADVLLLDEPDNYLDIPAKLRLEKDLRETKKTVLIISHDRQLLSASTDKTVTLEASGAWVHGASYATYPEARKKRLEAQGDELKRWKDEERRLYQHYKMMKERAKISPKLTATANAAESKWKRFVEAGEPPAPITDQQISVRLRGGDAARRALSAKDISIEGLIKPFDVELRQGERIGLIGPNGSGKSHTLRLFAGTQKPSTGELNWGNGISTGMFTQVNNRPDFMGEEVEAIVERIAGNYQKTMLLLSRYGLAAHGRAKYDTLSGGQKARLEILYLELEGHNLLLLDEPTDNLDIDSSEALEQALEGFRGTCVSVSHDRSYLEQQDRFLLLQHDGKVSELLDFDAALEAILTGTPGRNAKLLSHG